MEQRDMQELLTHPERLDASTLLHLRELVARYPYFQTAWVLYLKNLFILSDPSFKEELRRGALFVADLSMLFYYIEGERFLIKKHNVDTEAGVTSGSDRTLTLIDRFLAELPEKESQPKTVSDVRVPVEMPSDYTSVLLSEVTDEEKAAAPLHGQELIDQFIENTEAAEKLSAEHSSTDDRTEEPSAEHPSNEDRAEESSVEHPSTDDRTEEPSAEHPSNEDRAEESSVEHPSNEEEAEGPISEATESESEESYFTETLAKIYVRQQRYDKALEIIKKLNLKYPKKNAYFADQIRFLEKLIINAKSK